MDGKRPPELALLVAAEMIEKYGKKHPDLGKLLVEGLMEHYPEDELEAAMKELSERFDLKGL